MYSNQVPSYANRLALQGHYRSCNVLESLMDSGSVIVFLHNFHDDVSKMLPDCVCVCICVLCVFVTVFDVQLYGSECFFRRKTFAVKIIYLLGGFCFRTILISSNGNICYSLFTLSVVVVSRFASH